MGIQHVELPHKMGVVNDFTTLEPVDRLVYVYMKKHAYNNETYISVIGLADECNLNPRTVNASIKRLLESQELFLTEKTIGHKRVYKFNPNLKRFEKFSFKCLDELKTINEDGSPKYTTNEKCVIICMQEFENKMEECGFTTYSLNELASYINMPLSTLKKTMKSLERKGIASSTKIPKSNKIVKRIDFKQIFQDICYTKEKMQEYDTALCNISSILLKVINGEQITDEEKNLLKSKIE